jgi:hypothetical protein
MNTAFPILLVTLTALLESLHGSFVAISELHQLVDPEDQIDYLSTYLEDFAALLTTLDIRTELYDTAVSNYTCGLKEQFLQDLARYSSKVSPSLMTGGMVGEAALQDILTHFQDCAHRALPSTDNQTTPGRYRSRRAKSRDKLLPRLFECTERAELDISVAVADAYAHLARLDGGRESDRVAGWTWRLSRTLRRIVEVRKGAVMRWPWLTDEGWTWQWIGAALVLAFIGIVLIGALVWIVYRQLAEGEDGWGETVEHEDQEDRHYYEHDSEH